MHHPSSSHSKKPLPPKPKVVLFDWDGTLVDTKPLIVEALNKTFEKMGRDERITQEEFNENPGHSLKDMFPRIFPDQVREALTHFYGHIETHHLDLLAPLPGAHDLLKLLKEHNIKMGIISNKRGDILRKEIKHLNFGEYFYNIIGSGDLEFDKPSSLVVEKSLLNTGIDKGKNVWFIGDSIVDMTCANQTGCLSILIHNRTLLENQGSWHMDLYSHSCMDLHETVKMCMI